MFNAHHPPEFYTLNICTELLLRYSNSLLQMPRGKNMPFNFMYSKVGSLTLI